MSMCSKSAGKSSEKYRRFQELEKCEHVTRFQGLYVEKQEPWSHRTCTRVLRLWLSITIVFLSVSILLYLVLFQNKYSEKVYGVHPALSNIARENQTSYHEGLLKVEDKKVISCYYNAPSENNEKQLLPSNINAYLCTHINVAFASISNKEIYLDGPLMKTLSEIVDLKHQNTELKILLSVGGAGNNNGFSDMVVDHASRKTFIRSIKRILRSYSLDGIDLDWEFPVLHGYRNKLSGKEKQHFSQLLREIRMEFYREKRNYILTIAAASPQIIVDVSYDVDQINLYVDYVNIMTYDFHYYTKYTPFTGFNSPLYPRSTESLYLATLNINNTINMYIDKGLDKNKIVVGIPTYGHTFTLVNINNFKVGSPASGFGSLGVLGFINYPNICTYLKDYKKKVQVNYDKEACVPYLHSGNEWVSYDNPQSVMEKAVYIKERGLRGAMIYSLNADDYEGACEGEAHGDVRFPLAHSVRNALVSPTENSRRNSWQAFRLPVFSD